MTGAEFDAWLLDTRRNRYRVLLVELDHAGGTVRSSDVGWRSNREHGYRAYDPWLTKSIIVRDSLDSFRGVGDIVARNVAAVPDWTALDFRGSECRILYGDSSWAHSEFRVVATTLIDGCESVDGLTCQWKTSSAGSIFNRVLDNEDAPRIGTAESVIASLVADAGGAQPTFTRVPAASLAAPVSIDLTGDTTLGAALLSITDSLGVHVRMTRERAVEVFVPSTTPDLLVTASDLAGRSISTTSTVYAKAHVIVEYDGDEANDLPRDTGADTGDIDETERVQSVLTSLSDRVAQADREAVRWGARRRSRQLRMLDRASLVQVGDVLDVRGEDYTGPGLVTYLERALPLPFTTVEIETA